MESRYKRVKEFTEKSLNKKLPEKPQKMTRGEVHFVTRMILEELQELLLTVANPEEDLRETLIDICHQTRAPNPKEFNNDVDVISEQVDAFVDIDYYGMNACAKSGMDADEVYNLVHDANMAKRFEDGEFHKNEHGKIIKPPNWQEPNVKEVVRKWLE
tara:strand:- start:93 stop:566 length:474 start_codon:yes stop_codon:yes gene_type:complete